MKKIVLSIQLNTLLFHYFQEGLIWSFEQILASFTNRETSLYKITISCSYSIDVECWTFIKTKLFLFKDSNWDGLLVCEANFKHDVHCTGSNIIICDPNNSTFPPWIFSHEARYGIYLPSVMNQSQGMIFFYWNQDISGKEVVAGVCVG